MSKGQKVTILKKTKYGIADFNFCAYLDPIRAIEQMNTMNAKAPEGEHWTIEELLVVE